MLKCSGMEDCSFVKTPMVPGLCLEMPASPLSTEEIEVIKDKPQGATGKFTWLTNGTRPDIAYAADVLAHFRKCARESPVNRMLNTSFAISKAQWTTSA